MLNFYILTLLFLSFASYFFGKKTIQKKTTLNQVPQHSRDTYHGFYLALYLLIPSAILILIWVMISPNIIHSLLEQKIQNTILLEDNSQVGVLRSQVISISEGIINTDNQDILSLVGYYNDISQLSVNLILVVSSISSLFLFFYAYRKINIRFNARTKVENIIKNTMIVASLVAILTTIGIVLSLIIETIEFFKIIKVSDFLFGLQWSPQIALREDQVANEGLFGAIPLFLGTILITVIAMCVAVPIGLLSAIYLSEYSNPRIRAIAKPMLEILAGIPTVVYGFFAALTVAPFLRDNGATLGLSLSSESALAAGIVMGIMIIPLISSLSDDVINSVPQSLRDGSYAIGATQSETIKKVVIPAALPGIIGSILLAVSRAIGETMIVVMAAGLAANLTINPLDSTTTITTQIVMILVGDQEFNSPKTQSAFALGLTLFIATLILNYIALRVVKKYREKYE